MSNVGKQAGPRRGRKITPAIEKVALEMAAQGATTRAIAAHITKSMGVEVSHAGVAKLLVHTRSTRAEVAKVVVRESLSKSLLSDLEILEKWRNKLDAMAEKLYDDADRVRQAAVDGEANPKLMTEASRSCLETVNQIRQITHTRLHFSGAGEPDKPGTNVTRVFAPFIMIPPESAD